MSPYVIAADVKAGDTLVVGDGFGRPTRHRVLDVEHATGGGVRFHVTGTPGGFVDGRWIDGTEDGESTLWRPTEATVTVEREPRAVAVDSPAYLYGRETAERHLLAGKALSLAFVERKIADPSVVNADYWHGYRIALDAAADAVRLAAGRALARSSRPGAVRKGDDK